MTASLSKKAIGESHRPRGKGCVSWQAEAARHAVIPVPLDTDGIEERLDWRPIAFRGAPSVPAAILRACRHLAARYRRRGALLGELFDVPRDGRPGDLVWQLKGERVDALGEDRAGLTHGRMIKRQVRT
jgi:hypothetical protein